MDVGYGGGQWVVKFADTGRETGVAVGPTVLLCNAYRGIGSMSDHRRGEFGTSEWRRGWGRSGGWSVVKRSDTGRETGNDQYTIQKNNQWHIIKTKTEIAVQNFV